MSRPRFFTAFAISAVLIFGSFDPAVAQDETGSVLVVSRTRILTETEAARSLRRTENNLRDRLKEWVDLQKSSLEEEEQRLTALRAQIDKQEFDALTDAFDKKVRGVRRDTQRYEAAIQSGFREARKALVQNLYPILIEILQRHSASLIIDSDQILIADPKIDMTDEVIALYDQRVAAPELAPIDLPLFGPEGEGGELPAVAD
ncbi:MAG: OmpH family outer membrane protein [Pseudomonadota bacterium]